ncbi:MAG: hypothetical protein CMH61_01690 [Nanoarchaeota archaeon]|nr:hypothetical protein [Nanoarchaeota archaeon]|tara:strand:+ start:7956 stop:8942 length:987 start_codon:yes stop_codon:yes gene_type:complete
MFRIPLADLKKKILESNVISSEELDEKIKSKINELSGLISEEGAGHIIANELGIKLFKEEGQFKIKELYAGMRGIETVGKVTRKFELREFSKNDRVGKVASFVIGDETGTVRVVLWNEQTDIFNSFNENDVISIKSGFVKENNNQKEIHINDRAKVEVNPSGVTVGEVKEKLSSERKRIGELQDAESGVEILGTIVQIFDPHFFTVCPECNKRVTERDDGSYCPAHGKVEATQSYVMNLVVDDGSGHIRTVLWKNQTNNLLGKQEEQMKEFKGNPPLFDSIKTDLLGEQVKLTGRVTKNTLFDRLEFNVQLVYKADPAEEIKRLENSE